LRGFGEVEGALESAREPPLFLNGVGGLGAPHWRADFASRFVGDGDTSQKIVAVVESVVFLVADILREIERVRGAPRVLRVGGGLAQLDGLCERLASVAAVPVERLAETETTALGLARLLGAEPKAPEVEEFEPVENAVLRARHERWRGEMPRTLSPTA